MALDKKLKEMKVPGNARRIAVEIIVSGETQEDFKDNTASEILKEFKTYYGITRPDFDLRFKD